MKILNAGCPRADGFYMPAEYAPHKGTIIIWPKRPGLMDFTVPGGQERLFAEVICAIAESEQAYVLAEADVIDNARSVVEAVRKHRKIDNGKSFPGEIYTNGGQMMPGPEMWGRPSWKNEDGAVRGIDWCFNAWGGKVDGLYADWTKDDRVAALFCNKAGYDMYDAHPFVLEGGAIHTDGEKTVIVTESCLLSKGRNPELSKSEIEQKLKDYLGAEKIIWIPYGIYNDETNEHVDNVCAFTSPGHVVLAWTDDMDDPQYQMSSADLEILENETDARGRKIEVHKVYIPKKPVCITEYELSGFTFEEGEDEREAGERLAASYVNFYITNGGVLIPQFGDVMDEPALKAIGSLFEGRKVYPIYARDIIVGGGNIHCITQQIPQ